MAQTPTGHQLFLQQHLAVHSKTAGIEPFRFKADQQLVSHPYRGAEIGVAIHDRQGHTGLLPASAGEDRARRKAKAFKEERELLEDHQAFSENVMEAFAASDAPTGSTSRGRGR